MDQGTCIPSLSLFNSANIGDANQNNRIPKAMKHVFPESLQGFSFQHIQISPRVLVAPSNTKDPLLNSECLREAAPRRMRNKNGYKWVWLKIHQEGQTAGFGPRFHLPGQPILEFRFFEPQPNVATIRSQPMAARASFSEWLQRHWSAAPNSIQPDG